MIHIYDNGALMLGNILDVIREVERESETNLDMCFVDQQELLKDLKELYLADNHMIVCINYEQPMGYSIDYWRQTDKIEKENN